MQRATGVRISWQEVPLRVRNAVEARLGSRVVEAHNQSGGFSPGLGARLRTADGYRVFLKAACPELNPQTPVILRQEARVAGALPAEAPVSRLLWVYDEGDTGWIALAFGDIDGRLPTVPWQRAELERVMGAIGAMHDTLTPSPLELPTAGSSFGDSLRGWVNVHGDEDGLDDWSRRHLDMLTELERAAPEAAVGDTILHFDLRADNILLTDTDVVFVDWPNASVGASWVDVVGMAASVALEGGPQPEEFLAMYPAMRIADPRRVTAVAASFAGFFTAGALQPPPPGLPTVRAFQAAQGEVLRRWLARRLDLK